ncbi:MAG: peroxiredoxin family protein [Pseudomonadota bacterium]
MRLKSLLLTPLLTLLSVLMAAGVWQFLATGAGGWAGVAIAAAPLPLFVGVLMLTSAVARTSANLPLPLAISVAGALAAIALPGGTLPALLAIAAAAAHIWYVFVYSRFGRQPSKTLRLGAMLPDFTLTDEHGNDIGSAAFRDAPALFLFFRGNWCPLCMAQIREVADDYKRLAAQGVEVVLVSPQPEAQTAKLAAKFDVPFHFLTDKDLKAATALDIAAIGGTPVGIDAMGYGEDTVMPTVIATDRSGRIIFLDQTDNYRVRPEPETFLAIFEGKPLSKSAPAIPLAAGA